MFYFFKLEPADGSRLFHVPPLVFFLIPLEKSLCQRQDIRLCCVLHIPLEKKKKKKKKTLPTAGHQAA